MTYVQLSSNLVVYFCSRNILEALMTWSLSDVSFIDVFIKDLNAADKQN